MTNQPTPQPETVSTRQYADESPSTDTTPTTDPTAEVDADSPALTGDDE
jgi:hypothetical protein